MREKATPQFELHVGDVSESQLVIGNYNTVQTPKGAKVTVIQAGGAPAPRLRAMPIAYRPAARTEAFGREEELALAGSASAGSPVQLYGGEGIGKTTLLRLAAERASPPAEGVVLQSVRRRSLDEVQVKLYTAFWECDVPFLPDPAQVGGFLIDREALVIVDDCGLDREDLDALLEGAPRCAFVIGSEARALWSGGTARALPGLDPAAGVALLERELGEAVGEGQREDAEAIVERLDGRPQSLVETAALIRDGSASLRELAHDARALDGRIDPETLTGSQRRILGVLGALDGAALGAEHVAVLADAPRAAGELAELERHGWVKSQSPRYRLARDLPEGLALAPESGFPDRLLDHLAVWARGQAKPAAIAAEGEGIEAALALGADSGRWRDVLSLAVVAGTGLALAGAWASSRSVLSSGLAAARALESEPAEAHFLHQLGSFALCLGESEAAISDLGAALQIRERLGDREGAELTRHNLGQVGGGPGSDGGGDGGGPWRPTLGVTMATLAALAALILGGVVLASKGGDDAAERAERTSPDRSSGGGAKGDRNKAGGSTDDRKATSPIQIDIYSPDPSRTYDRGETIVASFSCTNPADGSEVPCYGTFEGSRISDGDRIYTTDLEGEQTFTVAAVDRDRYPQPNSVTFTVGNAPYRDDTKPPTDGTTGPTDGTTSPDGTTAPSQTTQSVPIY